ncbi:MAG: hypothetical protein IPM45_10845 [Acidimicrobiales bacterium]|nr:hypothetical protein [Acidimicrobiales bacterium]
MPDDAGTAADGTPERLRSQLDRVAADEAGIHPTGNRLAHPDAQLVVGAETVPVTAELADAHTFDRLWPRLTAIDGGYDTHLRRLTDREPRMFLLHPASRRG